MKQTIEKKRGLPPALNVFSQLDKKKKMKLMKDLSIKKPRIERRGGLNVFTTE